MPTGRWCARLAVRGGLIAFAGSVREAMALKGPRTRLLDLGDATVIPGIIDAHAHLLGLGEALRTVDLTGARTYQEVVERVAARARSLKPGEWILGRGWDQNAWPDRRFPTLEALSRAVPDNPVRLTRVDGHALLANARALQLAGVTAATPDPSGGRIIRDAGGAPTGVLVDEAMNLVERVVPPLSREETRAAVLAAVAEANRWGLTGIHDPGVEAPTIDLYEELARAGQFKLRDYVMVAGDSDATIVRYLRRGPAKRPVRRAPVDPLDQALRRRRAGLARRRPARGLQRRPREPRARHHQRRLHPQRRDRRPARRLPGVRARHRRPRQPLGARRVPGGARLGAHRRSSVPHRARAGPLPAGHPAVRRAGRDPLDADQPPDQRHVLGGGPPRLDPRPGRLRLALAPGDGRGDPQRHRLPGRGR